MRTFLSVSTAYLHDIFIDLLGVPVDQVYLLGVALVHVLLLVDVVLVRHGVAVSPEQGGEERRGTGRERERERERDVGIRAPREVKE